MRVRFTPTAKAQFLAVVAHIRRDDPRGSVRFRKRVEKTLRRLQRFPESGRQVPEFPDLPYREVVVASYRFFYRLDRRVVWIVAVWHGARLPGRPGNGGQ